MLLLLLGTVWAGELTLDMFDVGQGDGILLTTPRGERILVDAGTSKAKMADALERMGIEKLDLVVGSHPHADHIGGLKDIIERFPVGGYLHSGDSHTTRTYRALESAIDGRRVESRPAKAGQLFDLGDGATMKVIWPGTMRLEGTRSDLNSNSVVLRIENGEDCMLLTGDAEEDTERALLRHNPEPCGLLKVAHHGSRHSTSQAFLNAIQPSIALISAGADNRYGHPGEETLRKLERMDVAVYRTDLTGHVTVVSTGQGLEVIDGLPSDAPLRVPRNPAPGPVEENDSVEPMIIDPMPPPPPPEPAAVNPSETLGDDSETKSVEEPVDQTAPPQVSFCQRLVRFLTFWK